MAKKESAIVEAVRAVRNRSAVPILKALRSDAPGVAVVSKLTQDRQPPRFDAQNNLAIDVPSTHTLRQSATRIAQRKNDAENIMATLPDLELICQLYVSSILAPRDGMSSELTPDCPDDMFKANLKATLLEKTHKYFSTNYKIKDQLAKILRESLFMSGSHPMVVLPENALDELINGQQPSLESIDGSKAYTLSLSLNLLGNPDPQADKDGEDPKRAREQVYASLESIYGQNTDVGNAYNPKVLVDKHDSMLRVSDNFDLLKLPFIHARRSSAQIKAALKTRTGFSLESILDDLDTGIDSATPAEKLVGQVTRNQAEAMRLDPAGAYSLESGQGAKYQQPAKQPQLSDRDMMGYIYKSRNYSSDVVRVVKTQDQLSRRSVGEPLILSLPSESVIPVYVPGNEERHVGFFVLIDENGNPLTKDSSQELRHVLQRNQTTGESNDFASSMLARVRRGITGEYDCDNRMHQDMMVRTYTNIIEADLLARLRNGVYSSSAKIASNQEIYRLMLTRALMGQMTQALWIPAELMTYFAFDYDAAGIGRSLLDRTRIISSLRAMVLFSKVRAATRNSIGLTKLNVKLDPDDPAPEDRVEKALHAFMRTRQESLPVGVQNPNDLVEWMARSGVQTTFTGHEALPDIEVDISETSSNHTMPDTALEELLEKYNARAFGITPEMIDNMYQPEHATTLIQNNRLYAERILVFQEAFNLMISDHSRKVGSHSENLTRELAATIMKNFDEVELTDEIRKRAISDAEIKRMIVGKCLRDFLDNFTLKLAPPVNMVTQNQLVEMNAFEELLDKELDAFIPKALMDDSIVGELGGNADNIREIVKAYCMRQEFVRSGVFRTLDSFLSRSDLEAELADVYADSGKLIRRLVTSFSQFSLTMQKFREASDKAAQALDAQGGASSGSLGSTDPGSDSGGSDFPSFDEPDSSDDSSGNPQDDAGNKPEDETAPKDDGMPTF